jgi:hydrogenase maturation protein HypF
MLPYTPLHALLMADLRGPVIATSGNLTDDPICFDEREAVHRLHAVADLFLVHNRPILRPVDDSVVRFIDGQAVLLRRARGYAPLPIDAGRPLREVFSTGAHMKNTVAFSRGSLVFLSQHLGDLESEAGAASHRLAAEDFERVYQVRPALVAHDAHPGYGSTSSAVAMAGRLGVPTVPVQHHEAHVWAAMAEHHLHGPLVGVSWDGSGWGPDGTVWGGEFLVFEDGRFRRAAHLRTFALPGGEQAVREPRRSLLGVLDAIGRAAEAEPLFAQAEWRVLRAAMARGLNSPRTTSAGRLFDAAAALAGLTPRASFEGQAAMELEYLAESGSTEEMVALTLDGGVLDWAPLVETLLERRLPQRESARLFHNSIAGGIVTAALQVGIEDVVLTGGCFQNALLTGLAARALRSRGFRVHTHRLVPPNDGALALGQVLAAAAKGD